MTNKTNTLPKLEDTAGILPENRAADPGDTARLAAYASGTDRLGRLALHTGMMIDTGHQLPAQGTPDEAPRAQAEASHQSQA